MSQRNPEQIDLIIERLEAQKRASISKAKSVRNQIRVWKLIKAQRATRQAVAA